LCFGKEPSIHKNANLEAVNATPSIAIKHLDGNNLNESWDNLEEVVPMNKNKKYPGVYWRVRKSQYEVKFYLDPFPLNSYRSPPFFAILQKVDTSNT
jgi:hypothetical protein